MFAIALAWMFILLPLSALSAPYAAYLIDARTGEVLHETNAHTRLHPASLTKMMTLYVAFEAIAAGEISLDTEVTISRRAANEVPSKLGLRAGQKIQLRYLIRAAAVRSANDAATAIGEAIEGSVEAYAARMNRSAKAMGMTRTHFKNMHGLTEAGHLSTAHDMTILGRHLLYDYPQYYNLFSRRTTDAGIANVANTNRRLLDAYPGADGIKTGYTRAAGSNLVASAERGNVRVIATVFGGQSSAHRNQKVAELMDLGFQRAPRNARLRPPSRPAYSGSGGRAPAMASAGPAAAASAAAASSGAIPPSGKTIRLQTAVRTSLRPVARPGAVSSDPLPAVAALQDDIQQALEAAQAASAASAAATVASGQAQPQVAAAAADAVAALAQTAPEPTAEVQTDAGTIAIASASGATATAAMATAAPAVSLLPRARPATVVQAAARARPPITTQTRTDPDAPREVVTRVSTSGGRQWGVNLGRFNSRGQAERVLLQTALLEMNSLDGSLRRVVARGGGFDANFMGMTRDEADLACRRLQARQVTCFMLGPPPG